MKQSAYRFFQKLTGEGAVRLLSIVFMFYLARSLGAEDFGRYSSAFAFACLFSIFVDLGTNSVLTRDLSRHPDRRLFIVENSHALKLMASLGTFALLVFMTFLVPPMIPLRFLILPLGLVVVSQTLSEYFSALLAGKEEMGWEAILKIVFRFLVVAAGAYALFTHMDLTPLAWMLAAGSLAGVVASHGILRARFGRFGVMVDGDYIRSLVKDCFPISGSIVFWIFYDNQDILILTHLQFPAQEIGYFAAAAKILDVIKVYPILLTGAFFPRLSQLARHDLDLFIKRSWQFLGIIVVSSLALILLFVVTARPLVSLLFGPDFVSAVPLFKAIVPAFLGIGINHFFIHMLIALGEQKQILLASGTACVVNVVMAYVLLPYVGVVGACLALLISEVVHGLLLFRGVWTGLKGRRHAS